MNPAAVQNRGQPQAAMQRTGAMPVYQSAVDFQFAEFISNGDINGQPHNNVLTILVPPNLTKRKLYCYTCWDQQGAATTAAAYFTVEFLYLLTSVGRLPVNSGKCRTLDKSVSASMVSVASSVVGSSTLPNDCLTVSLAQPQISQAEPSLVHLMPFYFDSIIDTVRLNYDRGVNCIQFYRVILAMVSTL
jgi:hypothetical protein